MGTISTAERRPLGRQQLENLEPKVEALLPLTTSYWELQDLERRFEEAAALRLQLARAKREPTSDEEI